jgi:hypothetical protein
MQHDKTCLYKAIVAIGPLSEQGKDVDGHFQHNIKAYVYRVGL